MGIIGIEHLAQDIFEFYSNGMDAITESAFAAAKECAEECLENIREDSPEDTGKYKSGWAMSLSYTGAYAAIGADPVSETEFDFTGALTRSINKRIEEGRKYNGVSLNQVGGLKCEGAAGKITMADGQITFYSNPTGTGGGNSG